MLGTPRAINSLHCATPHSMPSAFTSSSVLHFKASRAKASGKSQWKVLGTTESWESLVKGLMPGIIGTSMPSFRARST